MASKVGSFELIAWTKGGEWWGVVECTYGDGKLSIHEKSNFGGKQLTK